MYVLTYWFKRGRAEQIRLLLQELDQPYREVNVVQGSPEWRALQAEGPGKLAFGAVPMLEDGGFRLVQGPVIISYLARKHGLAPGELQLASRADSIAWGAEDMRRIYLELFGADGAERQAAFVGGPWKNRWLPAFEGLLAQNDDRGVFVGGGLTHADVAVWDAIDAILTWVAGATLDGHPRLARFYDALRARPRIAAYLASDRRPKG
jgi:glutathione S-transferase